MSRLTGKVCALTAATLIVPSLAFASHDKDNDGKGKPGRNELAKDNDDKGKEKDRDPKNIPVVPEANAGWVLIPFVGAVLLFSWRQFARAKASSQ
jgi:hypothetical protein